MKIGIVLGTRPEIIKMSSIIDEILKNDDECIIIHTGQHYDIEMSQQFFSELELPLPNYNIGIGVNTAIKQISIIISKLEEILIKEKVDIVLVQGDTNAVLAGALAANKLKIPVGHIESGLRSFDKDMPEEINRIVADNCSNLFFAPTENAAINLQSEGINHNNIYITGNTIVDACKRNLIIANKKSNIFNIINFDEYIVLTLHRAENVDNPDRLSDIINSIINLKYNIIFPIHPHTEKSLRDNKLYTKLIEAEHIQITKPLGYLDFLNLLSKSKLILTDSGGVQEEAIILNIPCVTLRYNTERPETIYAGGNILSGTEYKDIQFNVTNILNNKEVYNQMVNAINPYGNGDSSKVIYNIIQDNFKNKNMYIKPSKEIFDFKGYYMKKINQNITVSEFEEINKNHIIVQIFNDNLPEYIDNNTKLYEKTVIVKKFKKQ